MKIDENVSLKPFNTFGVDVKARYFTEISSIDELIEIQNDSKFRNIRKKVLGGGSNILFTKDFDGLVLKINIKGRKLLDESDNEVLLEIGAGENWDNLVHWTVENNWGGIENMVMIPGTVGGAAAQNIAAYGQNISDVLESLDLYDFVTQEIKTYTKDQCQLTYRSSIFKRELKDKAVIIRVRMRLENNPEDFELDYHERKARYGSMIEALEKTARAPYSLEDVMNAVIHMRSRRLPSIEEYGSCGSFFKNPVVTVKKYKELSKEISELQSYPVDKLQYSKKEWDAFDDTDDLVKIPAARLLDELGYNGKWSGNVGVSEQHALCVVSNRKASGYEILEFTNEMKDNVWKNYGVKLESEVDIVT